MPRIDWHDDPAAPPVNSLVPAAAAFVERDGEILLIQRSDNGKWSMPGGTLEFGESLTTCVVRETLEETGIHIQCTGLVGVFTDPLHRVEYDNGEVRQQFAIVYRATYLAGELTRSSESPRVEWVPRARASALDMDPSQQVRIAWAIQHPSAVRIDPA
ncbi:NUDIX domain-containing protein [Nocardioides sp. NBC_00850]|uniref:NUDIX hydrolase n=1 Tax=Nocardioides sp. NBC_00850 TaxID=2976001 RepID=UPI00386879E0|nr:NUDIX domain-containing protein [Nocardioides sp. NBC_00850]